MRASSLELLTQAMTSVEAASAAAAFGAAHSERKRMGTAAKTRLRNSTLTSSAWTKSTFPGGKPLWASVERGCPGAVSLFDPGAKCKGYFVGHGSEQRFQPRV
jgi:hypothetical protein